MACIFTRYVKSGKPQIMVNAFDESFAKWVHLQASCPNIDGIGRMDSSFSVPPAEAAAIGAALIAAAKAAGWVEAVREMEPVG